MWSEEAACRPRPGRAARDAALSPWAQQGRGGTPARACARGAGREAAGGHSVARRRDGGRQFSGGEDKLELVRARMAMLGWAYCTGPYLITGR